MFRTIAGVAFAFVAALPAHAEFVPVSDRDTFLRVLDGREIRMGVFQIALKITPDGKISGSALGWDVTGNWAWENGFFCREIDWSGKAIPYNCQLVEVQNNETLRFTVDQGAGDAATFTLR
jgi:hypothetical protein